MERPPRIAITLGDPTGVGPEVVAKALTIPDIWVGVDPFVIGSAATLDKALALIGSNLSTQELPDINATSSHGKIGVVAPYIDTDLSDLPYGQVSPRAGAAAVAWASAAGHLAMNNDVDAIVTAPISKEAARMAGHEDFGHQEIYQHLAGVPRVLTMLLTKGLRVVHLTTHHPLSNASVHVTTERVLEALQLTHSFFESHGFAHPRIGVAALNPHNGEAGLIGSEEIEQISPAVQRAVATGIDASGPIPADTVFGQAVDGRFDVVLAMYHDQGHIAVKMHNWRSSLTLNLGLPFLRTSVDHGTAFDIAGQGVADPTGMIEAIRYATGVARTGILPHD